MIISFIYVVFINDIKIKTKYYLWNSDAIPACYQGFSSVAMFFAF